MSTKKHYLIKLCEKNISLDNSEVGASGYNAMKNSLLMKPTIANNCLEIFVMLLDDLKSIVSSTSSKNNSMVKVD